MSDAQIVIAARDVAVSASATASDAADFAAEKAVEVNADRVAAQTAKTDAETARTDAENFALGFGPGTATTLAPGATPTLDITGPAGAKVLDLGIPAAVADDASMEAVRANPASAFAQGLSTTFGHVFAVDPSYGDGVTNATAHIQSVLDAASTAGGGDVLVSDGTYLLTAALTIGSNTHLRLSAGATMKRGANTTNMIYNKHDGVTGGFAAAENVTISGGTWDGNRATYTTAMSVISGVHITGLTVQNVAFTGVTGGHAVEINSVDGCRVLNCDFLDYDTTTTNKEWVQIEGAFGSSSFLGGGAPYDQVLSTNVLIQGNRFTGAPVAVGQHGWAAAETYKNVQIIDNTFLNSTEYAVRMADTEYLTVSGNRFVGCAGGIYMISHQVTKNVILTDNVISDVPGTAHCIHMYGVTDANRYIRNVVIKGNITRGGSSGIRAEYLNDVSLIGNDVADSNFGIFVFHCQRAAVVGNTGSNNTTHDIGIGSSTGSGGTDAVVLGNLVAKMSVANCARTIIAGNVATSSLAEGSSLTDLRRWDNFVAGAMQFPRQTQEVSLTRTATYTPVKTDSLIIMNGSSLTLHLPSAVTFAKQVFKVKNIHSTALTIDSPTSGTIDGAASKSLAQWEVGRYYSDGTNWYVI